MQKRYLADYFDGFGSGRRTKFLHSVEVGHGDIDGRHAGKLGLASGTRYLAEHLCGLHDVVLDPPDRAPWLSFAGIVVHLACAAAEPPAATDKAL